MSTQAITSGASKNNGATVMHGGNVSTTDTSINVTGIEHLGARGQGSTNIGLIAGSGLQVASINGSFAYNPSSSEFIGKRMSTTINGKDNSILLSGDSPFGDQIRYCQRMDSFGGTGRDSYDEWHPGWNYNIGLFFRTTGASGFAKHCHKDSQTGVWYGQGAKWPSKGHRRGTSNSTEYSAAKPPNGDSGMDNGGIVEPSRGKTENTTHARYTMGSTGRITYIDHSPPSDRTTATTPAWQACFYWWDDVGLGSGFDLGSCDFDPYTDFGTGTIIPGNGVADADGGAAVGDCAARTGGKGNPRFVASGLNVGLRIPLSTSYPVKTG